MILVAFSFGFENGIHILICVTESVVKESSGTKVADMAEIPLKG